MLVDLRPARFRTLGACALALFAAGVSTLGVVARATPAPATPAPAAPALGPAPAPAGERRPAAVVGDVEKLANRLERGAARAASAQRVVFGLGWSRARSSGFVAGRGVARLDRAARTLEVELSGLAGRERVDLWLVPFGAGEAGARRLGGIELAGGAGRALVSMDPFAGLELDRLVVARAGASPEEGGLLHGAPGLLERVATRRGREVGGVPLALPEGPPVQVPAADLGALVGLGEQLFFRETFGGNGRTCGTCHPAENDFTLDPAFIAGLPPTDALFVAERIPALDARRNGGLVFENPRLMRELGLIVVNADGFDEPSSRFVLRSVQHLLGLGRTLEPAPNLAQPLVHLLGWSGDGSSGSGSLREFAEGAVKQHFPRTMARVPGQDFRLPSARESNALEAFMLSLGRERDMDLERPLSDLRADVGRQLFSGLPGCNLCHRGGGSQSSFVGIGIGDFLQNTGVELLTQRRAEAGRGPRPVDGGFGTNPLGEFDSLVPNVDGSYGERTFNSQSVIEAASSVPSFHSHLTGDPASGLEATIEGAVRFYTTPEFSAEAGFPIDLTEQEIADLGRFLRVLSALDDLDTIERYARRAADAFGAPRPRYRAGNRLARLAAIECRDAISVLEPVGLHPAAVGVLAAARAAFDAARRGTPDARLARIGEGLEGLALAREQIVGP